MAGGGVALLSDVRESVRRIGSHVLHAVYAGMTLRGVDRPVGKIEPGIVFKDVECLILLLQVLVTLRDERPVHVHVNVGIDSGSDSGLGRCVAGVQERRRVPVNSFEVDGDPSFVFNKR